MRALIPTFAGLLAVGVPSCSVVIDAGTLDEGCPSTQKVCDGICVPKSDPTQGCSRQTCAPCVLSHATATCDADGQCAVGTCDGAYADCDNTAINGCEVDLDTDKDNCGRCLRKCEDVAANPPHVAALGCALRNCVVTSCEPNWLDCDQSIANGCEVDRLTRTDHCGDCKTACTGTQTCSNGICQ